MRKSFLSVWMWINSYWVFLALKYSVRLFSPSYLIPAELRLCHRHKFSNPYIFATWWCKPLFWVFATNTNFPILISLQPDDVNLCYFELSLFDHSLKYLRSKTLGCKDMGLEKSHIPCWTSHDPISKNFALPLAVYYILD